MAAKTGLRAGVGVLTLVSGFALGGMGAAIPSMAHAYSGCWGSGPNTIYGPTRWCHTYINTYTWMMSNVTGEPHVMSTTGILYAGNSWFVCQSQWSDFGDNIPIGNARNNWWLLTLPDRAWSNDQYHQWGWVPANAVSGGGNYQPIPGLRFC